MQLLSFGAQRIVDEHNCTEDQAMAILSTAIDYYYGRYGNYYYYGRYGNLPYFDTAWVYSKRNLERSQQCQRNT